MILQEDIIKLNSLAQVGINKINLIPKNFSSPKKLGTFGLLKCPVPTKTKSNSSSNSSLVKTF